MHRTTTRSRILTLVTFLLFCLFMAGCAATEPAAPERFYNGIPVGESWYAIQSGQDVLKNRLPRW